MPSFNVRLKNRQEIAAATMAFLLQKPANFQFKAGQTIDMTLIDPPETDGEGNTRTFTIASPPHASELAVATRMRDTAFKRTLRKLALGAEIKIDGPFGDFTLSATSTRPAAFLAGGIGITPFRSIILDATRQKVSRRLFLFYSNRRPEDAAFLEELEGTRKENPNYQLVATMTGPEKSRAWSGPTGYINQKMLADALGSLSGPIYYLAGPPGMVAAMRQMLATAGVSDDDIRTEEFAGYE
ncbi:MAG: FAD-dependent oxidoreductase [Acidobacteriia bacterium]|nr:FAD-dependent oxidoreductase [Terriglobia bacterium]